MGNVGDKEASWNAEQMLNKGLRGGLGKRYLGRCLQNLRFVQAEGSGFGVQGEFPS